MGAGQVAKAHEELIDDFTARKLKRFLEQFYPPGFSHWVVDFQKPGEPAVAFSHILNAPGVFND